MRATATAAATTTTTTTTAIVVGAGIGGLAAALSLRRAGCELTLVEQVSRFAEVGAGILLAPNAPARYGSWACSAPSPRGPPAPPA
jgi:cation diffusion facilitator CzcD-associated flavoprotein CzcO